MIHIAAVDDELHILKRFERIAGENTEIEICGLYQSGEELLSFLCKDSLDAVFLDVEIGSANGIDLYEKILSIDEKIEIIFVTAYNKYAVDAFELQALDYLLKPLTKERFEKTISRLKNSPKFAVKAETPFIQCFGSFQLISNGMPVTWKNSKAKEILAFLVSREGAPVDWEKIVDAIWPSYTPDQGHANFHATIYLLRRRLVELGLSRIFDGTTGNYRLVRNEVDCDLFIFQDYLRKRLKTELTETDRERISLLYQGGFMENEPYGWVAPKAASLERAFRRLLGGSNNNFNLTAFTP